MKAIREKRVVTYKEIPIRPWADFSTETFQARSKWDDTFKILGGGVELSQEIYTRLAKLSFRNEGGIKKISE